MSATFRKLARVLVGAIFALSLGCGERGARATGAERDPWSGRGRECVRPFVSRDGPYGERGGIEEIDDPRLAAVPPEAARTMRAAGLAPLVSRALAGASLRERSIDTLMTRQDLGMRLISLETQLAAVIFEAECTGELIEAMTFELEDRADQRDLRLALASLVVGAISATAAGVWDLVGTTSKGPPVLALVGGFSSAALGGAAFVKSVRTMQFEHPRNLLAPLVHGRDDDELYPRFVFRLLTLPSAEGERSPRERMLARFRALIAEVVEPDARAETEALLYGEGGVYTQDRLALRERLYDVLETELNAQARDLELLDRFLVRALEHPR
ncbi:MAG: hypothetical protein ABW252_18380 [Polyangiales bacterium]